MAQLRAVFTAKSEVEAILIADQIKVNGEVDLDQEEGDSLDVTQVTSNQLVMSPEDTLVNFRKTRNLLIRTRVRQAFELAQELDKLIFMFQQRLVDEAGLELSGYSYGDFMDLALKILHGEEPTI